MDCYSKISIFISFVALAISAFTWFQNKRDSFQQIASLIIAQKAFFLETYEKHADKYDEDENSKYLIDEAAANYCNALESACALYLDFGISRKLFKTVFKDELITVVKNEGIASFLEEKDVNGDIKTYESIRKVIAKWNIVNN